jgi:hypothetical protein
VIDEVTVVIIDLEQHFDAIYGEDRAVVLAIRVISSVNASKAAIAVRTRATAPNPNA